MIDEVCRRQQRVMAVRLEKAMVLIRLHEKQIRALTGRLEALGPLDGTTP